MTVDTIRPERIAQRPVTKLTEKEVLERVLSQTFKKLSSGPTSVSETEERYESGARGGVLWKDRREETQIGDKCSVGYYWRHGGDKRLRFIYVDDQDVYIRVNFLHRPPSRHSDYWKGSNFPHQDEESKLSQVNSQILICPKDTATGEYTESFVYDDAAWASSFVRQVSECLIKADKKTREVNDAQRTKEETRRRELAEEKRNRGLGLLRKIVDEQ